VVSPSLHPDKTSVLGLAWTKNSDYVSTDSSQQIRLKNKSGYFYLYCTWIYIEIVSYSNGVISYKNGLGVTLALTQFPDEIDKWGDRRNSRPSPAQRRGR